MVVVCISLCELRSEGAHLIALNETSTKGYWRRSLDSGTSKNFGFHLDVCCASIAIKDTGCEISLNSSASLSKEFALFLTFLSKRNVALGLRKLCGRSHSLKRCALSSVV